MGVGGTAGRREADRLEEQGDDPVGGGVDQQRPELARRFEKIPVVGEIVVPGMTPYAVST